MKSQPLICALRSSLADATARFPIPQVRLTGGLLRLPGDLLADANSSPERPRPPEAVRARPREIKGTELLSFPDTYWICDLA